MTASVRFGSPAFEALPRLLRLRILEEMEAADMLAVCQSQTSRLSLIYCGIGDPSQATDREIVYEHWRHWLRRDFGIAHSERECAALTGIERRLVSNSMHRHIPTYGRSNLELLESFRRLYVRLFQTVLKPLSLPGKMFWSYRDGVALVSDTMVQGQQTFGVGSLWLVCVVDVVQVRPGRTGPLYIPHVRVALLYEGATMAEVAVSGTHGGLYCVAYNLPFSPLPMDGLLIRLGEDIVVRAHLDPRFADSFGGTVDEFAHVHTDPLASDLSYVTYRATNTTKATYELSIEGITAIDDDDWYTQVPTTIATQLVHSVPYGVDPDTRSIWWRTRRHSVRSGVDGDEVVLHADGRRFFFVNAATPANAQPIGKSFFSVPRDIEDENNARLIITTDYGPLKEVTTIQFAANGEPRVLLRYHYRMRHGFGKQPQAVMNGGRDYVREVTRNIGLRTDNTAYLLRLDVLTGAFDLFKTPATASGVALHIDGPGNRGRRLLTVPTNEIGMQLQPAGAAVHEQLFGIRDTRLVAGVVRPVLL